MAKHTAKLPVRIYHYYQDNGDYWQINDKYNNYLAICKDASSAALLLRCCNSHKALVEALNGLISASATVFDHTQAHLKNSVKLDYITYKANAEQALKLAEEE